MNTLMMMHSFTDSNHWILFLKLKAANPNWKDLSLTFEYFLFFVIFARCRRCSLATLVHLLNAHVNNLLDSYLFILFFWQSLSDWNEFPFPSLSFLFPSCKCINIIFSKTSSSSHNKSLEDVCFGVACHVECIFIFIFIFVGCVHFSSPCCVNWSTGTSQSLKIWICKTDCRC